MTRRALTAAVARRSVGPIDAGRGGSAV